LGKTLLFENKRTQGFASMDSKGGWVLIIGIFGMNGKELKLQHTSNNTQLSIVMTFLVRECYGSPKKHEF
jgi:hypothetical protein